MLKRFLSPSILTLLLLAVAFGVFYSKEVRKVVNNENTCICAYDGFGYYMYLPHLMKEGNLRMTNEWAQGLQNEYCGGIYAYQLVPAKNGQLLDVYHMGQAYLEAPSFLIGHTFAKMLGYKTDGFSKPYHIAYVLNAFLFILLGLIYFRKLCLLFFNERITVLLMILGFIGTNYWITATLSYSLQHLYLFAVISAFAYFFFKSIQGETIDKKAFIISAILFGLCCAVRPTHALIGALPGLILLQRYGFSKTFWKWILWFPAFALLWNIPQILYWKTVGGSWIIMNLHTEDLTFFDPYTWKFLFSYRKGWLIYTPLFFLLVPAFWIIYRKRREFFWPFLALTLLFIWTFSSWECWWYASSFGQRTMVDLYPLLLLPIGFLFFYLEKKALLALTGTFVALTTVLCVFQSWQMKNYILPADYMTKEHYWYIFGKTNTDNYENHRMLINRGDTTWVSRLQGVNDPNQRIEQFTWYRLPKPMVAQPNSDLTIIHLPFFGKLKTDETRLEVTVECSTSDTTQSVALQMESAGKYNCYGWENMELSLGLKPGKNELKKIFNIPDVRHKGDYLQIYIHNPSGATVHLDKLSIKAASLIRH